MRGYDSDEPVESIIYRVVDGRVVEGEASPHVALVECLQIKTGHDAKVVASTTKGKVQVRMRGCIDIQHTPVGDDKLIHI